MRFAALLLLAGCDKIFTLTPPEPTVPPRTVTLTYDRLWLGNRMPQITTESIDPETLSVTKLDGTDIPFTRTGLGTYQFTTDAAVYAISAATMFGGIPIGVDDPDAGLEFGVVA